MISIFGKALTYERKKDDAHYSLPSYKSPSFPRILTISTFHHKIGSQYTVAAPGIDRARKVALRMREALHENVTANISSIGFRRRHWNFLCGL